MPTPASHPSAANRHDAPQARAAWLDDALPPVGAATRLPVRARLQPGGANASSSERRRRSCFMLLERRDPKRQKITPADAAKTDARWPLLRRHRRVASLYLNPKNTRRVQTAAQWVARQAGRTVEEATRCSAARGAVIETGSTRRRKRGDRPWDNRRPSTRRRH